MKNTGRLLKSSVIFSLIIFTVISCGEDIAGPGDYSGSAIDSVSIIIPEMPYIESMTDNTYILRGTATALTAKVKGRDEFDKTVRWAILGLHHSSDTFIDEASGVLTIAADEDHGMPLSIRATSITDSRKSDLFRMEAVRHLPSAFTGEWELAGSAGNVYVITADTLRQFINGTEVMGSRHTIYLIWPRWNSASWPDYPYGYALGSAREQMGMAVTNYVYFHIDDPNRLLLVWYPGTAPGHFRELRLLH